MVITAGAACGVQAWSCSTKGGSRRQRSCPAVAIASSTSRGSRAEVLADKANHFGRRYSLLAGVLLGGGVPLSYAAGAGAAEACDLKSAGASMIQFCDLKVGSGGEVFEGDVAKVNYTGSLLSGQVFDSGRFFVFGVGTGEVIRGWDLSLAGDENMPAMQVGGVRRVVIPSALAYGSRGAGGVIPPDASLQFEIEVVSVK